MALTLLGLGVRHILQNVCTHGALDKKHPSYVMLMSVHFQITSHISTWLTGLIQIYYLQYHMLPISQCIMFWLTLYKSSTQFDRTSPTQQHCLMKYSKRMRAWVRGSGSNQIWLCVEFIGVHCCSICLSNQAISVWKSWEHQSSGSRLQIDHESWQRPGFHCRTKPRLARASSIHLTIYPLRHYWFSTFYAFFQLVVNRYRYD